jgi:hypothetical protein
MKKNVKVGEIVRVNNHMSRNGLTGTVTQSFMHNDLPSLMVKFDEDGVVSYVLSQNVQVLQPLAFSQLWLAAFAMAFGVWLGRKNML